MKVDEIFNKFCIIENKYDLFNKKVGDIYFWKVIRFALFQAILRKQGLIEAKNISNNRFKRLFFIIKSSIHSAFRHHSHKDIIVLENPRKVKGPNGFYDPYTSFLIENLREKNTNFEIIDEGFDGIHFEKASDKRFYADDLYFDIIYKFLMTFRKINFSQEEKELLEIIKNEISSSFNFDVEMELFVKKRLVSFRNQYVKYKKLFQLKTPELIYIVCSYGKEGLICAANEEGVTVAELQHGIMSRYHAGYSFPDGVKIHYFPDKMLLFGKYWFDSTPLPLLENDIQFSGYYDLNNKLKTKESVQKEKKRVLFVSQWTIGKELSLKAVEAAQNNPDYTIVYRFHPVERNNWRENYKALANSNLPNLLFDDGTCSIYEQLMKSEYVVCVYSMAVFEALTFGSKVILLELYGVEYMDYLISNGYVTKKSMEENLNFSEINEPISLPDGYFFGESFYD